jgi:hypothetical protein
MRNLRYCGELRFRQDRTVLCPSCGAARGDPCRTTSGRRVGRAVSYTHKARTKRWNRTARRKREMAWLWPKS